MAPSFLWSIRPFLDGQYHSLFFSPSFRPLYIHIHVLDIPESERIKCASLSSLLPTRNYPLYRHWLPLFSSPVFFPPSFYTLNSPTSVMHFLERVNYYEEAPVIPLFHSSFSLPLFTLLLFIFLYGDEILAKFAYICHAYLNF